MKKKNFQQFKFLIQVVLCGCFFIGLSGVFSGQVFAAGLRINEVMSANTQILDGYGRSSDWIEIYNNSDQPVNLAGYGLSDDSREKFKWTFPQRTIQAGGYIVVFASGSSGVDSQGNLYADFRLSDTDGQVILTSSAGQVMDSLALLEIPRNLSLGRHKDGSIQLFRNSTPGAANSIPLAAKPEFSLKGGFYSASVQVDITSATPGATICYTLNGRTPNPNSAIHSGPITISKTTTIRATAVKDGFDDSAVAGQTYFIDFDAKGLPILTISTEEENLWDPGVGIFPGQGDSPDVSPNLQRRERRPIFVEYYDTNGKQIFAQGAEIQVIGASSRHEWMRPFKISANEAVDPMHSHFEGQVLKKPLTRSRHYQVRNNNQEGIKLINYDPFFKPTLGIRNALMAELMLSDEDFEMRFDNGSTLVIINGYNFGVMNFGEKRDNSTIAANHPDIDGDDVDMIVLRDNDFEDVLIREDNTALFRDFFNVGLAEYEEVSQSAQNSGGSKGMDDFFALIQYIQSQNLNRAEAYAHVKEHLHLESFIASMAAQIIAGNIDFTTNNIAFWRHAPENNLPGPFHTYNYDFDATFGLTDSLMHMDSLSVVYYNSLFLPQLLKNPTFKNSFIRKFDQLLNGPFRPDNASAIARKLGNTLAPWIPYHLDLWASGTVDTNDWQKNVNDVITFLEIRPTEIRNYVEKFFQLKGSSDIEFSVSPAGAGEMTMITDIFESNVNNGGQFFNGIPLTIQAKPKRGYRFLHFQVGSQIITDTTYTFTPNNNLDIVAYFEKDSTAPAARIAINEIANSGDAKIFDEDGESQDWIELYNTTDSEVNLSGLYLSDDENDLTKWALPEINLAAREFLIVYASGKDRRDPAGEIHTSFGLNDSEPVILTEDDGETIVDQMTLLEIIQIQNDNSGGRYPDGSTVFKSMAQPTPGEPNTIPPKAAQILTPKHRGTINTSEVVFQWDSGVDIVEYQLNIGRKSNISRERVSDEYVYSLITTDNEIHVTEFPLDDGLIFAVLWSKTSEGNWLRSSVMTYRTQKPPAPLVTREKQDDETHIQSAQAAAFYVLPSKVITENVDQTTQAQDGVTESTPISNNDLNKSILSEAPVETSDQKDVPQASLQDLYTQVDTLLPSYAYIVMKKEVRREFRLLDLQSDAKTAVLDVDTLRFDGSTDLIAL